MLASAYSTSFLHELKLFETSNASNLMKPEIGAATSNNLYC